MIKPLLIFICLSYSAITAAGNDQKNAIQLLDKGEILPLQLILEKVREKHNGKVLEVELEKEHGQHIYEIELLSTDGKVLELKIDAKTGALISTEEEH